MFSNVRKQPPSTTDLPASHALQIYSLALSPKSVQPAKSIHIILHLPITAKSTLCIQTYKIEDGCHLPKTNPNYGNSYNKKERRKNQSNVKLGNPFLTVKTV